ncbi:phage holin family protein [Sphingomonas mesophila]|uniref:phage holin family protein n=1 Tax=Sphingomonas mesophila TaxID=2303576 RepID=UPI000E57C8FF|nr:phage holin family protein [Sphingomonas mesophila]
MIDNDLPPDPLAEPHVVKPAAKRRPAVAAAGDDANVVDLLKQLAGQGSHLAEQQMALIKAEIRESTSEVKTAAGAMAGAAVVGLAGLGVLLMGVAYLLGDAIDNVGLGALIVGAATLLLAYILYRSGAAKLSAANLEPKRTERTLQRATDVVRGDLSTENAR